MTRSKKSTTNEFEASKEVSSHLLDEVYEAYRRDRHFNLKKVQEKIYTMNLAEAEKYSILVLQEAKRIYDEKGKPRPHPNYFMAVCRRLRKEGFTPEPKQHLGKTI